MMAANMAKTKEKIIQPSHFINRELSWLEFNARVLREAADVSNPVLERLKFFTIFSSNLDEFFEVRVAGLKQQVESGVVERSVDGLTPREVFNAVTRRIRELVEEQYACWREQLVPALAEHGILFLNVRELADEDRVWVDQYYRTHIRPVLTPLAVDPAHPFPQLLNKSLNLLVQVESANPLEKRARLAIVQVPRVIPRLIRLPGPAGRQRHILLGHLIGHHLGDLFPGMEIRGYWPFRVTRNSELYIDEEEDANLLKVVEKELHRRRRGAAVRLEAQSGCPPELRSQLLNHLDLTENDFYEIDGPLNPGRLMLIYENEPSPELHDPPYLAPYPARLREAPDLFASIRKKDLLVHHPYESFEAVIDFLEAAAADPEVLAIKQTLYRTGGDTRVVGALMKGVQNGKQVTAVVELKARFDEANNIQWARRLEEAGVHVVYGLVGLKIHGKMSLVVRREESGIRRYVHLGTGNYNATTARIYTDLSLFTCHPDFGEDATNLFNLLTGICQFPGMRRFLVAPFDLRDRLLQLIQRETENAAKGLPARIIAKLNSLVDREMIEALYRASQAGVKIDLIVRGICCLRPGIKRISDRITVRSIVGRFLEHSRIGYFENACQPEIYVGSADWMPRNFHRRIEILFPVLDGVIKERIFQEALQLPLTDNVKAWLLQPDGSYQKVSRPKNAPQVNCQLELMRMASQEHRSSSAARPTKGSYPKVRLAKRPA